MTEPLLPPPSGPPVPTGAPGPAGAGFNFPPPSGPPVIATQNWERLDQRMLLVHPVTELGRLAIPLVLVVLGSGRLDLWHLGLILVPVALGVARYLTTEYRITEDYLERRSGLISRSSVRARLDRVRTVSLTANPVHRILGLSTVTVGTGDDESIELDALGTPEAQELRQRLLAVREAGTTEDAEPSADGATTTSTGPGRTLLRFDLRWVRFAPFTGIGLAAAAAGLAVIAGPFNNSADEILESLYARVDSVPTQTIVVALILLGLLGTTLLSVLGYLLTSWNFRLEESADRRTWTVSRGLLSTTETHLDVERLRGLSLNRGLGLRVAGGAGAEVLVTGLAAKSDDSGGLQAAVSPPAPVAVVEELAITLSGDNEAVTAPLHPHGPVARRRRFFASLRGAIIPVGAAIVVGRVTDQLALGLLGAVTLVGLALVVAADRYRQLGHRLTEAHLVIAPPEIDQRRHLLQRDAVISWGLRQNWFQLRAGVATAVPRIAAGSKHYPIVDVRSGTSVALAAAVSPELLAPFLVSSLEQDSLLH